MKRLLTILLCFVLFSSFISCEKENFELIDNSEIGTDPTDPVAPKSLLFSYDDAINDSTGVMYCEDNGTYITYGLRKLCNSFTGETKYGNYFCISNMASDNQSIVEESVVLVLTDSVGEPKQVLTKEGNIILEKKGNDNFDVLYFDVKEKEWKVIEDVNIQFSNHRTLSSVCSVSRTNFSDIVAGISMLNNLIRTLGVHGVEKVALGFWGMHVDLFGELNPEIGLVPGELTDIVAKGNGIFTIISYLLAKQDGYKKLLAMELGKSISLKLNSVSGGKECNLKYVLSGLEKSASIYANIHKVTEEDIYTSPAIAGMNYTKHTITPNANNGTFEYAISDLKPGKYYINLSLYSNKYKSVGFVATPELSFSIDYVSVETGGCVDVTDKSATVKYSIKNIKPGVSIEMQYQVDGDNSIQRVDLAPKEGDNQTTLSGLVPATVYSYKIVAYEEGRTIEGNTKSFSTKLPDISGTWKCVEEYYTGANYSQKQVEIYFIVLNPDNSAKVNNGSSYQSAHWSFGSNGHVSIDVYNILSQTQDFGTVYEGNVNDIKNPTMITGGRYTWAFNQVIGYVRHDNYHTITLTLQD